MFSTVRWLVLAMGLAIGGCAELLERGETPAPSPAPPAVPAEILDTSQDDYARRAPAPAGPATLRETPSPVAEIFRGSGRLVGEAPEARVAASLSDENGEITLNFVNADIADVMKSVLGEFLEINYVIGPEVRGPVTIQTSRPVPRDAVLPVVEQALQLSGFALVRDRQIYRVVPLSEAPREARLTYAGSDRTGASPGFGIEIVPIRYVNASEIQRLLEPLVPPQGSLRVDPTRNLVFVGGSQSERAMMLDNISMFDVDWLTGMSFALFYPRYTGAVALHQELEEVLGGDRSPISEVVRLVPIERLNAVLAISPQARYLDQLERWVRRLDKPNEGTDRHLFVYHVQNGRAADLASSLSSVLGASNSGAEADSRTGGGRSPGGGDEGLPVYGGGIDGDAGGGGYSYAEGVNISRIGKVSVTADEANNALLILTTPRAWMTIETALRQLDAEPLQVLLEAAIAEVTLTDELRYGVQYFLQSNHHQGVLTATSSTAITPPVPGFSYMFSDGTDIRIILDALSAVTNVEVISSPEVLVLNNQTARLQVGDQVPVATQQAVSVTDPDAPIVNSIQYYDTGVILEVTPRVNRGGMVMMDVSQEVSDVTETDTSTLNSPTIRQRKISSSVAIRDGETIALGGLIKDNRTQTKSGIPILKDVPVVGNLFRSTGDERTKTELMVLITPRVVDNLERARTVTEELRRKLPSVQPLLENRKRAGYGG